MFSHAYVAKLINIECHYNQFDQFNAIEFEESNEMTTMVIKSSAVHCKYSVQCSLIAKQILLYVRAIYH